MSRIEQRIKKLENRTPTERKVHSANHIARTIAFIFYRAQSSKKPDHIDMAKKLGDLLESHGANLEALELVPADQGNTLTTSQKLKQAMEENRKLSALLANASKDTS